MHTSVRGILIKDSKVVLIHRKKEQQNGTIRDYYVIPGGKQESGETDEETLIREMNEELGVNVRMKEKIIDFYSEYNDSTQKFYSCEYISGKLGTGNGPEFTNKEEYNGTFDIELIDFDEIKNINLVPEEIKNILVDNK